MVEYNSAETLDVIDTYSTDVMTGGSNKRMYLYNQLVHSLKSCLLYTSDAADD